MLSVIRTESQYDDALERVFELLQQQPTPNTEAGNELDVLTTLIEVYESIHHPMTASDPVEVVKTRMQQLGLRQADLVPFIGDKAQVSRILNHKRELTLPMIQRLSRGLNIPLQRLVG